MLAVVHTTQCGWLQCVIKCSAHYIGHEHSGRALSSLRSAGVLLSAAETLHAWYAAPITPLPRHRGQSGRHRLDEQLLHLASRVRLPRALRSLYRSIWALSNSILELNSRSMIMGRESAWACWGNLQDCLPASVYVGSRPHMYYHVLAFPDSEATTKEEGRRVNVIKTPECLARQEHFTWL
jgi:hypothetical protein